MILLISYDVILLESFYNMIFLVVMAAICGEATVLPALLDGRLRGEHLCDLVDGSCGDWLRWLGKYHHFY